MALHTVRPVKGDLHWGDSKVKQLHQPPTKGIAIIMLTRLQAKKHFKSRLEMHKCSCS